MAHLLSHPILNLDFLSTVKIKIDGGGRKGYIKGYSVVRSRKCLQVGAYLIGHIAGTRGTIGSHDDHVHHAMLHKVPTGIISNNGKFNRDLDTPRIREADGVYEYVLAWQDETQIDRDITLTEIDIENLIRAKGAIYSGCMTLLAEVGMGFDDVHRIILAGGFGSYVDLDKAMIIGLLPEVPAEKVVLPAALSPTTPSRIVLL